MARLFILTLTIAGLQFTWGVEMSYVNVYLLSLGMSKSSVSLVWAMGPLAGLVTQPVVGLLSDSCSSRYGRRRPFMIVGSVFVCLSLVTMAWAAELSPVLFFLDESVATRVIAILSVFVTDFSINTVQACCRALIVDILPASLQQAGNGWAARQTAVGHLIGYFLGFLNLVEITHGWIGDTQLKCLCIVSSAALVVTVGATSMLTREQVLVKSEQHENVTLKSVVSHTCGIFTSIFKTATTLPPRMKRIVSVQFFAWYGWFSFLYYSSTWVGEVYQRQHGQVGDDEDNVGRVGRIGSMSLTVFSIVSLVASFVMPFLATNTLLRYKPRLTSIWTGAHLVFSLAMFCTLYVGSVGAATAVVGLCGYSWAITTWAPFALMGEEIHRLEDPPLPIFQGTEETDSLGATPRTPSDSKHTGVYLGIHNIAISAPQFLCTFVSSFVFFLFEGEGDGGHAIAVTFQLGGVMTLVAAYLSTAL
ncbi:General alpha-glucoside permease [Yarrowia sp. C11]|nr:General alpha-glucoside permease [Yarrowia sp. E02]KAG5369623.1 General alpha-glucoside permease [Yarrowia sp. C11]